MSLINDMLQDLEKRCQPNATSQRHILSGVNTGVTAAKPRWWLLISGLMIASVLLLIVWLWPLPTAKAPAVVQLPPPQVADVPEQKTEVIIEQVAATPPQQIPAIPEPEPKSEVVAPEPKMAKTFLPPSAEELAQQDYQQALDLAEQGQMAKAIAILKKLLTKNNKFHAAREALAAFLLQQQQDKQAAALLKQGLQLAPEHPGYAKMQARLYLKAGDLQQALTILLAATPAFNEDPEYHAFIAGLYQQLGQPVAAANLYKQLINLQPNNSTWWMGLALCLEQLGKNNAALEAYHRATQTAGLNPQLNMYVQSRIEKLGG